jgi:putative salt-induced outer membrane protein YdiY
MGYVSLLAIFFVALFASPAFADEVQLKNGDRFSGDIIRLEGGKLAFKTAHGELAIPWADVTALSGNKELLIRMAGEKEPRLMALNGSPLSDITSITLPEPPLVISGGANAGFLSSGGNTDINNTRLDGEVVARARVNRYTFTGTVNRAKDVERETARNASITARYDRFLTSRLFVNANGIFTNDRFRDLDLRTAVGGGVGYQLLETALTRLSVEGGLGYVNENFESAEDDRYAALREAAKLDVLVVGDRVVVFHMHDGYFGVTGEDNLFVKMQNGIRFGLVGNLVTTAQLDLDYDRSPAPGRKTTDRTFALTFGYRF